MLFSPVTLTAAAVLAAAATAAADPVTFDRDAVTSAGRPRAIVAADFNRDGRIDLAVGGTGRDSIGILLNGDGGFRLAFDIVVGGGPFDLAAGDLDRDGIPDLAIANADADAVTLLIGRGDGSFKPNVDVAVGGNPRGIALADVTGDGKLDVLVTRYGANNWMLLPGNGAGGVVGGTAFATGARPQGIAAADFDHDGVLDVVVANTGSAAVSVYYKPGRPGWTRRDSAAGATMNVVTTGDFDRDGWTDVAAASSDQNTGVVLRGGPSGLATAAAIETGNSPRGITAADVDQDGRLDLLVGNRGSSTVTVNLGLSSGGFSPAMVLPAGSGSRVVAAADFDNDGRVDIASADELSSTVSVFRNTTVFIATGSVFSLQMLGTETGYGGATSLEPADFDHDGRLDLATIEAKDALVFMGDGRRVTLPSNYPTRLAVGDFNRDGHADVLASVFWDKKTDLYLGDGHGGFADRRTVIAAAASDELLVADLDRDGGPDVVMETFDTATQAAAIRVYFGQPDGTFAPGPVTAESTHSNGLALADLDRDGRLDLAADEFNPAGVRIRYGDGAGGWRASTFVPLPTYAAGIRAADFNRDGRLDLALGMWEDVGILLADPEGGFAPLARYPLPPGYAGYGYAYALGVGDLDLDGQLDIADNSADVKDNLGNGTFEPRQFAGWGSDTEILDYNRDGLPDIVMAGNGWTRILLGTRDEGNRAPTVHASSDAETEYAYVDELEFFAEGADPDQHDLRFEWRLGGSVLGTGPYFEPPSLPPGEYDFTVIAFDDRGGQATDSVHLTVRPTKEIYFAAAQTAWPLEGGWQIVADPTAAMQQRLFFPDARGAKIVDPAANPAKYVEVMFKADPTQAYKLWIRGKAQGNSGYNDSVFLQFSGSANVDGAARWRIGTSDALTFNLEECAGCGLSGWGWEDDGWGAVNQNGVLVRFPEGGWQRLRIQVREDGLSIDQVVLSSEKYLTTRPGTAKNDTTILPTTVPWY